MITTAERGTNMVLKTNTSEKTAYIVEKTMDYERFKTIKGNRNVNESHVKKLKDSMAIEYLLSPILVNESFYVIDGQHRFEAAKQLSLPIFYIMVPGYGQKQIQILNTNSSNWTRKDYLQAYCDLGKQPYLTVRNFLRQFPELGIQTALLLLTGTKSGGKIKKTKGASLRTKDFEEGKLVINDLEYAERTAKRLMEFKPFYEGFARFTFVQAMVAIMKNPNYKHKEFIHKLEVRPKTLYNCSDVESYKLLIEEIYNWKNRDKVSLRF